jgi:hypothetical protein
MTAAGGLATRLLGSAMPPFLQGRRDPDGCRARGATLCFLTVMADPLLCLGVEEDAAGPKTTLCPVRIGLSDGRIVEAEIYLLSDGMRPGGVTSVEGTLAVDRDFLPVRIGERSVLLRRDAIRYVEVAPDSIGAIGAEELVGSFDVVSLLMDSGEVLSGILRFPVPPESMRMSDVFNRSGRFLILSAGDRLVLVAKSHLVEASF